MRSTDALTVGWGGQATLAARIGGAVPRSPVVHAGDTAWALVRWSLNDVIVQ
jgi:hypothetical protein